MTIKYGIEPELLEKILDSIPGEPNILEIGLEGAFDFSSIYEQIRQEVPDIGSEEEYAPGKAYSHDAIFSIKNPTKESIKTIQRRSFFRIEEGRYIGEYPHVRFARAQWRIDDTTITLTPHTIEIDYKVFGRALPRYIYDVLSCFPQKGCVIEHHFAAYIIAPHKDLLNNRILQEHTDSIDVYRGHE